MGTTEWLSRCSTSSGNQSSRAPQAARPASRSLPCMAPGVTSGRGPQACAAAGSRLDGPLTCPCSQQPADPTGQRGDSPSELGPRRCPPCESPTQQGPWTGVLHPQQGALVDPGGLRRDVCRPLSSPGAREGHGSPSRQVLAAVMGGQSVLFSQPQSSQLCPHFLEVPWAVAPGKLTPHPAPAWTRARIPVIPLAVTGALRVGASPGASRLQGRGHGLSPL